MIRPKTATPRGILKTATVNEPRIEHHRYHASADLDPFIEHYWSVRWDLREAAPQCAETLPHPSVHVVFEDDGGARIGGVTRGKFSRMLEGKGGAFAIKFRPGGFYPFVRASLSTFTDRVFPLDRVWGKAGARLARNILGEDHDGRRIEIAEDFLRACEPAVDEALNLIKEIVQAIESDRRLARVDDLVERFGLPTRKLQRLFAKYVGVNPKWVIQRYRLHEAAAQLTSGASTQSALAIELGYSDQAHFIRDFKAIVGTSPAAYAERGSG